MYRPTGCFTAIRCLRTSLSLSTATPSVSTGSNRLARPSGPPGGGRRRILSENERRRSAAATRRFDSANARFREVQRERRLLIERHRDAIEAADHADLHAVVEAVEFGGAGSRELLDNISRLVAANPTSLGDLNDRELAVLLSAGGSITPLVSPDVRALYVANLWSAAKAQRTGSPFDIGIEAYNARIDADIANDLPLKVPVLLQELADAEVEADEQTFALMAKIYAKEGNTNGILKIIELLKEQHLQATQSLFDSLVFSISRNGEDDRASKVIQSLSANPSIDSAGLYVAAALGRIAANRPVDEVIRVFVDVPHSSHLVKKENLGPMLSVLEALLDRGDAPDAVEKIKPYLFLFKETETLPTFFDESVLLARAKNWFSTDEKYDAAAQIYQIFGDDAKRQLKGFMINTLNDSVRTGKIDRLVTVANCLRARGVIERPLTMLIDHAYMENLIIYPLYEKFLKSPEYEELADRQHILVPQIFHLVNEIKAAPKGTKTKEIFSKLFSVVFKPNAVFDQRVIKVVGDLLYQEALKGPQTVKHLIEDHQSYSWNVTTFIVDRMLWNEKLKELEGLMTGPLANEKVFLARVQPAIIRCLRQTTIQDGELKTIAKLINAGFPEEEQTPSNQGYGFRVIRDIFLSGHIADARVQALARLLVEEPRVSLSKEEIKVIESELRNSGKQTRVDHLKQLQRKSKTVLRWMSADIDELQKESEFLTNQEDVKPQVHARLLDIILRKHVDDSEANNAARILEAYEKLEALGAAGHEIVYNPGRYPVIALRRALQFRDFETAEKLWAVKKDYAVELKLHYAFLCIDAGKDEKAASILSDVKQAPEDRQLIRVMQNTVENSGTLEKFIELASKAFSISNLTRRRLTSVVKKMELRHAIASGDLEEAFRVASATTNQTGDAFGQNDLMAACVQQENTLLLKRVFQMVVDKHDRNTAYIDLMLSFLESGMNKNAKQLLKRAGNLYINSSKMEYVVGREVELKRPDVLHRLFLLVNDPDHAATADLAVLLEKTINLYTGNENLDALRSLHVDVEKSKFPLDRKLKAHLDASIVKVNMARSIAAKAVGRSNSTASNSTTPSMSSSGSGNFDSVENNGHQPASAAASKPATPTPILA